MSFDLLTIGILVGLALVYGLLPPRWRTWALLVISLVAVYALQPFLRVRYVDFILPTLTILLGVAGWWFTRAPDDNTQVASIRQDWITFGVVIGVVVAMSTFRYIDPAFRLTPSRPPGPGLVVLWVALVTVPLYLSGRFIYQHQRNALLTLFLFLLALFVVLKTEPLATAVAAFGRQLTGRDPAAANPVTDLSWLGFSYMAFRLLHTLRDRQTGQLPVLNLRDYMTYLVFFPAITAGPIDRAERFQQDLDDLNQLDGFDASRWAEGAGRVAVGMFKKFVIADTLALGLALNPVNAAQAEAGFWLWVLLYGYALRLFFDFSGYTDIAIGIGLLFGVRLPENFKAPYFKTNITTFWQSWHATLSNWARFYVFSPLSRWLLRREPRPSSTLIVLSTQTATMVTIGLWHGVTWNFLIWGIWHGLGLFVHKQWSDRTRKWYRGLKQQPGRFRAWALFAWFITFHYVVLGWVWFALPTPGVSVDVFMKLFGVR